MINLIKRNGSRVKFELEKWSAHIARMCTGVSDVSPSMIEMAAQPHFYDGMTTREVDEITLRAIKDLIDEEQNPITNNVNYQYVAGKQLISMLRKDVYGQYEVPHIYDIVVKNVEKSVYTPDLLTWYTKDEWDHIQKFIEHEKDEELPYAAVDQLIEKYLVQDRAKGVVYETPQVRYAIAAATAFHAETKNRLQQVREFYQYASEGYFTLSTPVLSGLGTPTKQFSSCVLISSDDTLKSIFATGQIMADYASKRAGIGLDMGRMRPLGAAIRKGQVKHTGIVPFLKKWFGDLRSCSQGGIRNASATVNAPFWHYQIDDFLALKNNQGTEETRVRHMDYAPALHKVVWKKLLAHEDLYFFDPNEVQDLYKAFYSRPDDFEEMYEKYSKRTDIKVKRIPAEVFVKDMLAKERSDTGRYYPVFADNVNKQGPFDSELHPVTQTNLCVEVFQHTRPFQTIDDENGRIALCTLGSMNWGKVRSPEELRKPIRVLARTLHNLLNYQDFLSVQSKLHNIEFEPIGIGVTNLAYWHAKRKFKYGDADALAEVKRWIEHQNFYATEISVDIAKEKGPCTMSHTTCYGKGQFIWERRADAVDELCDFTPSTDLAWEELRPKMVKYGVRFATTGALPPVESSSVVVAGGSTNGIAMVKELIVVKESKAGLFVQVVPEYKKLKKYYELLFDVKDCIGYLKTMAVLQAYTDQGISSDTFYSPKHFPGNRIPVTLVIKNIMLAHKYGLKSLYYHLVEKQPSLVDEEIDLKPILSDPIEEEEYCESCVL